MELASQPRKFLKKLAKTERDRIIKKLEDLSETPICRGARMVEGRRRHIEYALETSAFSIQCSGTKGWCWFLLLTKDQGHTEKRGNTPSPRGLFCQLHNAEFMLLTFKIFQLFGAVG